MDIKLLMDESGKWIDVIKQGAAKYSKSNIEEESKEEQQ